MKKIVRIMLSLFMLLPCTLTVAQVFDFTLGLGELMNANASRKAESQDMPANVALVITVNEINNDKYHSIEDLIKKIPGFFTSYIPLGPGMKSETNCIQ